MQDEIVLKDCPHCGGDARFAGLADWPYLSNVVFCPSCLVKGPQAPNYHLAALLWNKRSEAESSAGRDVVAKACPYCAAEDVVEGNNGRGNEPGHEGTLYFTACSNCLGRGPHVSEKSGSLEAWNRRVDD
ncbi:Lar family restriction alleviation protein [Porticoccaceae bacterium]|nr:Lar family restriction alleviation protein [Porticoccaceae bacterium]